MPDDLNPQPDPNPSPAPDATLMNDPDPSPSPDPEPQTFDWRAEIAGDDEKLGQQLSRYTDLKAFGKSWSDFREKVSAGNTGPQLPENPTDTELAEYRQQMGLPETPEGYTSEMPDGLVFGDNDMPYISKLTEVLHQNNIPVGAAHQIMAMVPDLEEIGATQMQEADAEFKKQSEEAMRENWGSDYNANLSGIKNMMNATGQAGSEEDGAMSTAEKMLTARTADGRRIGDDPEIMEMFHAMSRMANPAGFVAPGQGNQPQAVKDEIAEIEKFMTDNPIQYQKDEAKQARLRQLYEADDKLSAA
jgi:hypothetical protein